MRRDGEKGQVVGEEARPPEAEEAHLPSEAEEARPPSRLTPLSEAKPLAEKTLGTRTLLPLHRPLTTRGMV